MNFVTHMKFRKSILCFCLITLGVQARASVFFNDTSSASQNTPFESASAESKEFFTIDEDSPSEQSFTEPSQKQASSNFSAFSPLLTADQFLKSVRVVIVNLLRWTLHNEELPAPAERYMRKLHFGRWINDPTDETCMNTRARVLVRDNLGQITFRNNKQCVVDSGVWNDPYSGNQVSTAREIQIDHMVPLKNAYVSGAWQWDYKTRCLYANYLGYRNHLVSAGGRENMSKGDRAPDRYLPTNANYRCQYIKDWLAVKLIWKLTMTSDEVQSINEVAQAYKCDPRLFEFAKEDLSAQRDNINANLDFCLNR